MRNKKEITYLNYKKKKKRNQNQYIVTCDRPIKSIKVGKDKIRMTKGMNIFYKIKYYLIKINQIDNKLKSFLNLNKNMGIKAHDLNQQINNMKLEKTLVNNK